jgi:hypothetical protein
MPGRVAGTHPGPPQGGTITLRGPFATRSLTKVPAIKPSPRPDRVAGHHPSSGACSRNCHGASGNVSGPLRTGFISAISAAPDTPPTLLRTQGYRTQCLPDGTVPPGAAAFAAGPARDWLAFTDMNVIFAARRGPPVVWAWRPAPGTRSPGLRPSSLARMDDRGPAGSRVRGWTQAGGSGRAGCRVPWVVGGWVMVKVLYVLGGRADCVGGLFVQGGGVRHEARIGDVGDDLLARADSTETPAP